MTKHKLANVLLEHNDRFFQYRELYYKSGSRIIWDKETESSLLMPYASYDFTTYFNSFSNKKWHKYTRIDNAFLHLELKGRARIVIVAVKMQPVGLSTTILGEFDIEHDDFEDFEFQIPDRDDELIGFHIITFEETFLRNGYYYTDIDEFDIRDVHIALATTTFKKEDYIRKNVALFKDDIIACGDPVSENASFIVVDNGRTLDAAEFEGDNVYVFPNKNVGGSGGFARGMIEAKKLDPYHPVTHVLIMDDDISLSSESIKRTYNILALINEEYESAFVSGAMFSLGDQNIQIEDVGYANRSGKFGAVKARYNMNVLYDVVRNENDLPIRTNMYAAFWYCCIPMKTIKREGLPLPLFIRYDDAEYGQRCKPLFITMNGINVWHMDFVDRYSPYYERYCGTRNSLIIKATSKVCRNIDFFKVKFDICFKREMKKFNYGSAELLLDALEDYMKGPEFLAVEQCEDLLKKESAKCEKFVPLEELEIGDISLDELRSKNRLTKKESDFNRRTYNGQMFVPDKVGKNKPIAIADEPGGYASYMYHLRKKVLVVDRKCTKGVWRERDKSRFRELMARYNLLVAEYNLNKKRVAKKYAQAGRYLKSDEFWEDYLEIDKYSRA